MATFSEKMHQLVSEYRLYLRKTLTQPERIIRLTTLELKGVNAYSGDVKLYRTGQKILNDITNYFTISDNGYYSYSGIKEYHDHLKSLLDDHVIINEKDQEKIIHTTQHASNLLLEVIQLASQPKIEYTEEMREKLITCNSSVVKFGSSDQQQLYFNCIQKLTTINKEFFTPLLENFTQSLVANKEQEGSTEVAA